MLKIGGYYVAISYGEPDTREYIFKRVSMNHLEFTTHKIERFSKEKNLNLVHYVYIGKKIQHTDGDWPSTISSIKSEMGNEELKELESTEDEILKKQMK